VVARSVTIVVTELTSEGRVDGIAGRLRAARQRKKWGLRELARQSGVSHATISLIERGETPTPSGEVVGKLAVALGISSDELLGNPPPQQPPAPPSSETVVLTDDVVDRMPITYGAKQMLLEAPLEERPGLLPPIMKVMAALSPEEFAELSRPPSERRVAEKREPYCVKNEHTA
jgi:transcriptional regulator with XRE-family HTH domain